MQLSPGFPDSILTFHHYPQIFDQWNPYSKQSACAASNETLIIAATNVNVLQVTTSMDSRVGGPPAVLRALTPALAALGHTTEFVTCEAPESPKTETIFGSPIHRLGPPKGSYQFCAALGPWIEANAQRFDAVIIHGLWQHHGISTLKALKGKKTPYFVYTHGMLDPWFKRTYPLKHLKKWAYWNLCEKRVLKHATAVLFTCEEERRLARLSFSNYECTERVVEFGTARPIVQEDSARRAFAAAYPALAKAPFVLFMSRIHEKKGVDLLIRAYGELCKQTSALVPDLVIAGPCVDERYLAQLKALAIQCCPVGRVHWTGMIENEIKWGALLSSEAFILPSHQENFGIAVTEAMAVARPVLISDKVNIWREITDDHGGLAEADTIEGTKKLLTDWLALSLDQRTAMGKAAQESFERRFEIGSVARGLVKTIESFTPCAVHP